MQYLPNKCRVAFILFCVHQFNNNNNNNINKPKFIAKKEAKKTLKSPIYLFDSKIMNYGVFYF